MAVIPIRGYQGKRAGHKHDKVVKKSLKRYIFVGDNSNVMDTA